MKITENGKPLVCIVTGKNPADPVAFAAKELALWVREISGAKLQITADSSKGSSAIVLKVDPSLKLKADGFTIKENGNRIIITGSRARGVLTGVYRLLFDNTDIIWARPNDKFGTIYSQNPTLTFKKTNVKFDPSCLMRGYQFATPPFERRNELWQVRNGSTWSSHSTRRGKIVTDLYDSNYVIAGEHNIVRLYMPEHKYWKTHPEFYPLINGKRAQPSKRGQHMTNLCFTNKECLKEFTRVFMELVEKHSEYDTIGINQEDNFDACSCTECKKPIILENGKKIALGAKNFRSTQFFLWLNKIAEVLEKKYPEKKIKTLAYYNTEPAPGCRVKKNIVVSFCPIFKNSKFPIYSPKNRESMAKLNSWGRTGCSIAWREYYGNTGIFPRPVDAIAIKELRFIAKKYGIHNTYCGMPSDRDSRWKKGEKIWDQNSMYFWVLCNSTKDLSKSVTEWRNEFLKRVYGDAASDIAEYYSLIEKTWVKSPGISVWFDVDYASWQNCFDTDPLLKGKLRAALARAKNKKMSANGKIFLKRLTETFESMCDPKREVVKTLRVDSVPEFDPDFASGAWKDAPAYTDFQQMSKHGKPDTEKTVLKILHDDKNFYIGIKCFDKNGKKLYSQKTTAERDKWTTGNKVEILAKTADGKRMQLVVDSNGKIFDTMDRNGAWEGFFDIPVRKTDTGWSVLVTLPYSHCGYDKKPEIFRFLCLRYYVKNTNGSTNDRSVLQLFDKNSYKSRYPAGYPTLD